MRGNFVTLEDDHARWLVGEQVVAARARAAAESEAPSRDDLQQARQRRLSSVPADELPLGEDAIEMVHTTTRSPDGDEPSDTETTMDLTEDRRAWSTSARRGPRRHGPAADGGRRRGARSRRSQPAAEEERPARRPARKGRGRASVPSWDEIMFGGGKSD